jgi:hypothetical protein
MRTCFVRQASHLTRPSIAHFGSPNQGFTKLPIYKFLRLPSSSLRNPNSDPPEHHATIRREREREREREGRLAWNHAPPVLGLSPFISPPHPPPSSNPHDNSSIGSPSNLVALLQWPSHLQSRTYLPALSFSGSILCTFVSYSEFLRASRPLPLSFRQVEALDQHLSRAQTHSIPPVLTNLFFSTSYTRC